MEKKNADPNFSRREFIKTTGAAAITVPLIVQSTALFGKGMAPGDKINLGIIGCGGLGKENLKNCVANPNVVVVAACAVWKDRLDPIVEKYKSTCTGYTDFRQ